MNLCSYDKAQGVADLFPTQQHPLPSIFPPTATKGKRLGDAARPDCASTSRLRDMTYTIHIRACRFLFIHLKI